jgi:hypothetical protein
MSPPTNKILNALEGRDISSDPSTCSAPGAAAKQRPTRLHAGPRGWLWRARPLCSHNARRSSGAAPQQTAAAAQAADPRPHPHQPYQAAPAPCALSAGQDCPSCLCEMILKLISAAHESLTSSGCDAARTCRVARLGRSELLENSTACQSRSTRLRSDPTIPITWRAADREQRHSSATIDTL